MSRTTFSPAVASSSITNPPCAARSSLPARSLTQPRGIALGQQQVLELGNLDAKRDWGYAKEYVDLMWRMLQADQPDTFVIATNRTETVRDFVSLAFKAVGIDLAWKGQAEQECGYDVETGIQRVRVNPALLPACRSRPADW